jgi:hypothetical protein
MTGLILTKAHADQMAHFANPRRDGDSPEEGA